MLCNEKFRINRIDEMPMYDDSGSGEHISVCVHQDRYGLVDVNGNVIIPFVFDNIVPVGQGVLLAYKRGKVGLIHLDKNDLGRIHVRKFVNCLYDVVDMPDGNEVFFLRCYANHQTMVRAYICKPAILTDTYERGIFVSAWLDNTAFVEMSSENGSVLFNARSGNIVAQYDAYSTVGGYQVWRGVVLHQKSNNTERLLYIRKGQPWAEYVYSGEMTVGLTTLENGYSRCYGFLVINDDRIVVLNEFCQPFDFAKTTEASVKLLISNDMFGEGTQTIAINGFNIFFENE